MDYIFLFVIIRWSSHHLQQIYGQPENIPCVEDFEVDGNESRIKRNVPFCRELWKRNRRALLFVSLFQNDVPTRMETWKILNLFVIYLRVTNKTIVFLKISFCFILFKSQRKIKKFPCSGELIQQTKQSNEDKKQALTPIEGIKLIHS